MPDIFDQIHSETQAPGSDIFDQIHAEAQKSAPPPFPPAERRSFVGPQKPIPGTELTGLPGVPIMGANVQPVKPYEAAGPTEATKTAFEAKFGFPAPPTVGTAFKEPLEQIVSGASRIKQGLDARDAHGIPASGPEALKDANRTLASGLSDVIRGSVSAYARPETLGPAIAAGPVAALGTMAAAGVGQAGTEALLSKAGVPKEYAGLAGDLVGLTAVYGGIDYAKSKADSALAQHNLVAERLLSQERSSGVAAQMTNAVFDGERYPVKIGGRDLTIEYQGASPAANGRGFWAVVGEDGKPIYNGTGSDVQAWLRSKGAQPALPAANVPEVQPQPPAVVAPKPGAEVPPIKPSPAPPEPSAGAPVQTGATPAEDELFTLVRDNPSVRTISAIRQAYGRKIPAGTAARVLAKVKSAEGQQQPAPAPVDFQPAAPAQQIPESLPPQGNAPEVAAVPPAFSPQSQVIEGTPEQTPASSNENASAGETTAHPTVDESPQAAPAPKPEYSSTQVNLPAHVAQSVAEFSAAIPDDKLAEDGRQPVADIHATVKYGLHTEDPEEVRALVEHEPPVNVTLGKASLFRNEDADVLKVDVDSPDLHRLNAAIGKLPNGDTHPEYTPHVTVAYLKPGEGAKYDGKEIPGVTGQQVTLNAITFSGKDGKQVEIPLKGAAPASATPRNEVQQPATPAAKPAPSKAIPRGFWMNDGDIEQAVQRFKDHPVLSRATQFLRDFSEEANNHSDGWHSWPLPGHAATQLMGMIQHPEYATEENFKRALSPIRAFYTKHGSAAGMKFPQVAGTPSPAAAPQESGAASSTGTAQARSEAPEGTKATAAAGIADAVHQKLKAGQPLGNQPQFYELAEKYFGAPRSSGLWTPKDAMDAMEAGVNKYLIERGAELQAMPYEQAMQELRHLMDLLPTQGTRTDEQIALQQFSTPPTESFTAAKVANLKPSDVSLEPSAGNGGLAVWPKSLGAETHVNEISDRRREMLKIAGFGEATAHDGEVINSLLDRSIRPTVILMNPPFSAGTVKSGEAKNQNKYGFNHVESALQRLAPGGRLVAILGGGLSHEPNGGASLQGIQSGKWFQKLAKIYNIRANVRVNGKEYQKYGTNFATRIIVIDKSGPLKSWSTVVTGNAETLDEAYNLLRDVAASRPEAQVPARAGSQQGTGQSIAPTGLGANSEPGGPVQPGVPGGDERNPGGAELEPGARHPGPDSSAPGVESSASAQPDGGIGSGSQLPGPDVGAPANGPQGSAQNAPDERAGDQGSAGSVDLAGALGLDLNDIINAADQNLTAQSGPVAPAPTPKPAPKSPRSTRAPRQAKPPAVIAPDPAPATTPLSTAADEAIKRLRDRMKAAEDSAKGRPSFNRASEPVPVDPQVKQDLIDLTTIGAQQMAAGAVKFGPWSKQMMDSLGDLVRFVSQQARMTPEQVLEQLHQYSYQVAQRHGVTEPLAGEDTAAPPAALEKDEQLHANEEEDNSPYVTYNPTLKGAQHPGAIVETRTMATVPMPALTYRPNLPPSALEKGISAVQLEAVAIAGQQNAIELPSGAYATALIGDGTGVGKGRISAAILWDNYRRGRKRLIWVSEKWPLMQDAMRDLDGIGAKELMRGITGQNGKYVLGSNAAVQPLSKFKYGSKIEHDGVLFTTYATIRGEDKKGNRRTAQIEQYLRGDDEGEGAYILFDESHNLKNAVTGQGGKPSQIGQKVNELLQRLPKVRTVSLSATAATDVANLGYLDRLGLWGAGTAFPNGFREFQTKIAGGGLSAMELIARELKAQGKYVARTLSYKGVTYRELEHPLTDEQKEVYRTAAKAWGVVYDNIGKTIAQTTNGGSAQGAKVMSQFYGAQLRFFGVLISTLKIPTAVEEANKALADDKSVVITLINTNEAAQNREKNKARDEDDDDEIPDFDFGPKEMLVDFIRQHYPTQQYVDDVDSAGNPVKRPLYTKDSEGREIPVSNPEAEAARDALIAQINRDLHMPDNPLDILVQSFGGTRKVAEITGRKEFYDRNLNKFVPRGDPKVPRKEINEVEARNFQAGKKRVAILSSSGGTGISLHAGKDVANQQKRVHITLQVGWSADKQMQMFGRTHRTNQVHPPEYVLLFSDLGGERRFISTIARRLGSLGALTKGQKNATAGTDLMDKVNFESDQGTQATRSFYAGLLRDQPVPGTGLSGKQILSDLHVLRHDGTVDPADQVNVTRLMNRLLALDPNIQNGTYNYFFDIFQAAVQDAIDRGTLDIGVKALPGDEFAVKESKVISTDPKTGAETFYYPVDARVRTERLSPEALDKRMREHSDDNPRILRHDEKGNMALVIDAQPIVHSNGSIEPASYVSRPGRGRWEKMPNSRLGRNMRDLQAWATEEVGKAQGEVSNAERSVEYKRDSLERATEDARERDVEKIERGMAKLQQRLADLENPPAPDVVEYYSKRYRLIREAPGKYGRKLRALLFDPATNREYGWVDADVVHRIPRPADPAAAMAEVKGEIAKAGEDLERAHEAAKSFSLPADDYHRRELADAEGRLAEAGKALTEAQAVAANPMAWAKEQWREQYEAAPTHITEERHLIGGAVMRWWNPISDNTHFGNNIFTVTDSKSGQRVVGVNVPSENIKGLLARISGGASTVNQAQLYADVLRNNMQYTLEGGIQVRRGRVGRDFVIQLVPPNQDTARSLTGMGVQHERGAVPIYYVPENHAGPSASRTDAILRNILQQYPVRPEQPAAEADTPSFMRAIPGFYSQLQRAIEQKMPEKASASQVAAIVQNPQGGVKADELKWSGFGDWLKEQKGPVTKQQVLAFVRGNQVQVQEVAKGKRPSSPERIAKLESAIAEAQRAAEVADAAASASGAIKEGDRVATVGYAPSRSGYSYSTGKIYQATRAANGHLYWSLVGSFGGERSGRSARFVSELKEASKYPWLDYAAQNAPAEAPGADLDLKRKATAAHAEVERLRASLDRARKGSGEPTKFQQYVLPGGENYKELLLTLPPSSGTPQSLQGIEGELASIESKMHELERSLGAEGVIRSNEYGHLAQRHDRLSDNLKRLKYSHAERTQYRSPHWDEPNVLAHIRFSDRTGPNGEKILHVEEIQSDWHQTGREKGYRELRQPMPSRTTDFLDKYTRLETVDGKYYYVANAEAERDLGLDEGEPVAAGSASHGEALNLAIGWAVDAPQRSRAAGAVPPAPFTKSWHELAFRRALRWAAERGYDKLTWTTGEQQAERYDLSKQVSRLTWEPTGDGDGHLVAYDKAGSKVIDEGTQESKLPDYVGKEVAKKLTSQPFSERDPSRQEISGLDLKTKAPGMEGFYDKILPEYANRYAKKWGAKAGETKIPTLGAERATYRGRHLTEAEFREWLKERRARWENRTGEGWRSWNVSRDQAAEDVLRSMKAGESFERAMESHAGPDLAEELGSELSFGRPAETATVHSIDITPAMRKSVMEGQPLFEKGGERGAQGPITAVAKPGAVIANEAGMRALVATWNESGRILGVQMTPGHVRLALAKLRDSAPILAKALEKAGEGGHGVTVVDSGQPLGDVVKVLRHERFHVAQKSLAPVNHLGDYEQDFLNHPLAQHPAALLRDRGYNEGEIALELGANLAAGQYARLGLSRERAKELWFYYATLLVKQHGPERVVQSARNIAPIMKGALDDAIRNARPAAKEDRGEPSQGREGGTTGQGSVGQGIRRDVPGEERAGGQAPLLERVVPSAPGPQESGPGVSPSTAQSRSDNSERGSAPMLSDFVGYLTEKFGDDAPQVNYSGIGAVRRTFLPGQNFAEVEKASPAIFEAALPTAAADAITSTILQSAIPAIRKALQGSRYSWPEMQVYYIESRLRGTRERWENFAEQSAGWAPQEAEQAMRPMPDGTKSPWLDLLSHIEGRAGMEQDLGQTAVAIIEAHDWDTLREFLSLSYGDAADRVATAMAPEHFELLHQAVQNEPKVKEADRLYGELIEKPMADSHAINEGVFSNALGPANRYYPLVPLNKPPAPGPGRWLGYHKPKNSANAFTTGLSEAYDPGMEALAKKITYGNRANYKAALLKTMEDQGWLVPKSASFDTEHGLAMEGPDGREYKAVLVETGQARTLIQGGKTIHLPARFAVMPVFMNRALRATLEREPMDPDSAIALMRWSNMLATKGPLELVFHSAGVLGALYANTPFLGESGLDKALSLPLVKWFGIRGKAWAIDPTTPENVRKLHEMAKAGALPAKSGKVTYSKEFAEMTGAERERFSFAPMLYGPKGIDARARILMYDIFQAAYPNGSTQDLHHFVNQLGNYLPEMQGPIERFFKMTGIGPFTTAGMTRVVNAVHNYTGSGPGPGKTFQSRLWWWLTSSAMVSLAAWIVAYKHLTGMWPTDDTRARLFYLPVGGGHGYLDRFRHSGLGNSLWGTGSEVGYLNFAFFDNPLALRGARALGLAGAFQTHQLRGNFGQMAEAAQVDWMNTLAHPTLGPTARAVFVGTFQHHPFLTGLRDRSGIAIHLYPAIPIRTAPGLNLLARGGAALKELNAFYTEGAEHLGEMTGLFTPDRQAKGDFWTRGAFSILPSLALGGNLLGPASNPYAKMQILRQQRNIRPQRTGTR